MKHYSKIYINGQPFDLSHLNPRKLHIDIDNVSFEATISFGTHCFTDEKANTPLIIDKPNEQRYWSQARYEDSLLLPDIFVQLLNNRSTYVVPFKPRKARSEQYHYLDNGYYAIFFYIKNIDVINRKLGIYVVSAYDKTTYNGTMPKGKAYRLSWILSQRVNHKFILK